MCVGGVIINRLCVGIPIEEGRTKSSLPLETFLSFMGEAHCEHYHTKIKITMLVPFFPVLSTCYDSFTMSRGTLGPTGAMRIQIHHFLGVGNGN